MKVDLSKLEDSRSSFNFVLMPDEIDLDSEDINLTGAVKVSGNIIKHIAQTNVEGEIFTTVEIDCSRCLKKVENELNFEFSAAFVSPEHYTELNEKELDSDELEVSIIETQEIDLKELVREQILLAVPAQVLCGEDCKGLCGECGANKNLIDCNCKEKEIDPRWSSLKKFKK